MVTFAEDRISRDAREVVNELVPWAEEARAVIATSSGDEFDMSTWRGRAAIQTAGVEAEKERARMAARSVSKHAQLFNQRRHVGMAPFGYRLVAKDPNDPESTKGLDIDEAEAAVIRASAQRLLAGEPLRRLMLEWRQAGFKTHRMGQHRRERGRDGEVQQTVVSGDWSAHSMRRLLMSPTLAGVRTRSIYRRSPITKQKRLVSVEEGPGDWPAILNEKQHNDLVALLSTPGRNSAGGRRDQVASIPGSILVCGQCGGRLQAATRERGRRVYRCAPDQVVRGTDGERKSCLGVTVDFQMLEGLVGDLVVGVLDGASLPAPADNDQPVRSALDEVTTNLVELNRQFWAVPRGIDPESYRVVKADLEAHATRLRRELANRQQEEVRRAALERLRADGLDAGTWAAMPIPDRRRLIELLFHRIVVRPEGGKVGRPPKDPDQRMRRVSDRLDITWADQ